VVLAQVGELSCAAGAGIVDGIDTADQVVFIPASVKIGILTPEPFTLLRNCGSLAVGKNQCAQGVYSIKSSSSN
jgi:hypothetical protein